MAKLRRPEKRECERCGRREVWDEDVETWRVPESEDDDGDDDGTDPIGDVHCVHEWDIDGSFQPIE